MNYTEVRSQIASGDLLAWSHRSWASWYDIEVQAVRTFTQSEYCHAAIAWVVGGRVLVIEAVEPRVRIFPLSKLGDFYWIPTGLQWSDAAEERALGFVGTAYSKLRCIRSYFEEIPEAQETTAQCAMVARRILDAAGMPLECKETPSAVVQAALDAGGVLRYVSMK